MVGIELIFFALPTHHQHYYYPYPMSDPPAKSFPFNSTAHVHLHDWTVWVVGRIEEKWSRQCEFATNYSVSAFPIKLFHSTHHRHIRNYVQMIQCRQHLKCVHQQKSGPWQHLINGFPFWINRCADTFNSLVVNLCRSCCLLRWSYKSGSKRRGHLT